MDFTKIDDAMRLRQRGADLGSIRSSVQSDMFKVVTKSGTLPKQVVASAKSALLADIDAATNEIRSRLVALGVDPNTIP